MPQRFSQCRSAPPPLFLLPSLLLCTLFWSVPAQAEVRVVSGQGEHRMGDRDTREDAIRLATEAAKRNALEQVATYLESVTVVEGLNVTRDEIHTYTAGLVLVLDQQVNTTLDNGIVVVQVNLDAQIDTEEVGHAIAALRENEDARHQLVALKQENEQLQQELDATNQALANAATPEQTQQAAQQRQDILNRVQSNAIVSQAWTDYVLVSPAVYPYPWVGLAQTHALLNVARGLYPTSPHVAIAQQVIATKQPPVPPQPPAPPAPGAPGTMPSHQITPTPGSQPIPRTLNEITHRTPTAPPQIGNQPIVTTQPGTRGFTDVRQLNPLLPPQFQNGVSPNNAPPVQPGSRSARALQQFLAPPPTGGGQAQLGQPPIARRLPPTINQIHPPTPQQVPRVPYQIAPRGFGGGGHGGGGRGGGGGGRGGGGGGGGGRGR